MKTEKEKRVLVSDETTVEETSANANAKKIDADKLWHFAKGHKDSLIRYGGLILVLPTLLGSGALWLAMPITEAVTFCAALVLMGGAKTLTKS